MKIAVIGGAGVRTPLHVNGLTDSDLPIDTFGGQSMIVDYKGRIVGQHRYGAGSSYVAGTIDIDAMRKRG